MKNLRLCCLFLLTAFSVPALCQVAPTETVHPSVATISAANAPAIVYIMRHAEKPPQGDTNPDLIPAGYERARRLPTLFLAAPGAPQPRLSRPDVLFATARSKHSDRPVETITPLSAALHLPIHHDIEDKDTAGLVREVMSGKYAGKVVVICWHHGEIAHLAEAFGLPAQEPWHDDVFNQIWKIQWVDLKPCKTVIEEHLMPGDAEANGN